MQGDPDSLPELVLTAGAKDDGKRGGEDGMESLTKCCAGLDVHRATVVCTLIKEEEGDTQRETREVATFRRDLERMADWLKTQDVGLAVMEATGVYWKSVFEALEEAQLSAFVVNARHVKNVPGRKTDVQDSEWLAELARCGLLRPSFIPPRDLRELRLVTRYRRKLTGYLAGEKNRLHKVLDDCGVRLGSVVSDIDGVSARKMIGALADGKKSPQEISGLAMGRLRDKRDQLTISLEGHVSARHRFVLRRIQNHIRWMEKQMEAIDGQVVAAMEPYSREWELLQTIPGIDRIGAAMLLSEIGVDMSRFGNKDRLCSWVGVCPGNNESAGKKRSGRTRKGNVYVRQLLCEAANSAIRTESQFKGFYKGLVIRRGHKRAIVAVAHKILEVIFAVLKKKEPYKDPKIDYEALSVQRNAPRWINKLKKYGCLPVHC